MLLLNPLKGSSFICVMLTSYGNMEKQVFRSKEEQYFFAKVIKSKT